MQEDEKLTNVSGEVIDNSEYLAAIKELKANTVDKAKYEALQADNKRLLDAVINGQTVESESEPVELPSRLELYKKFKENNFSTDLDYWSNIVELRDATIREYGADPCVTGNFGVGPDGQRVDPEYGEAEQTAEGFETIKEMIKQANGNPTTFRLLMTRAMK